MDQPLEYPLHSMSLPLLGEYCAWELTLYQQGEAHNDQHCVELFRRVTTLRDPGAWQVVRYCFSGIISHWLRTHPYREAASQLNSEEYYVATAFARFWQTTTVEGQVVIPSLAVALHYLMMSLSCAVLDGLRSAEKLATHSVAEPEQAEALWEKIQHLLSDERELRLAYLLYYCGLMPREIVQLYPQEFGDVQEIYQLRSRVLERLQDVL
ncbi:MAG: hypothetical protein JO202_07995 [Ktedonobacteraceae bacterium]|nr:hypothetical protein [Ktedonobacteraceae bacterium]